MNGKFAELPAPTLQRSREPRLPSAMAKLIIFTFCMLMIAPLANGSFLYYFDTGSYMAAGEPVGKRLIPGSNDVHKTISTDTSPLTRPAPPSTLAPKVVRSERSIYYGIPLNITYRLGGIRLAILMQVVILAVVLPMFVCALGPAQPVRQRSIIALTIALTPVALFNIIAIPDLFAGTGIAACAILLTCKGKLGRNERIFWYLVLVISILVHNAVAFTLTILAAAWPVLVRIATGGWPSKPWRTLVIAFASVVVLQLTPLTIRMTMHAVDATPPFLLGRLIGDGTAGKILKRDCKTARWETCGVVPYLPLSENDFLWGGDVRRESLYVGYNKLPLTQQLQIKKESWEIIKRTMLSFGIEQIARGITNSIRQFFDVSLAEFIQNDTVVEQGKKVFGHQAETLEHSAIRRNPAILEWLTLLYSFSFVMALAIVLRCGWRMRNAVGKANPSVAIGGCLILGAAINALVCGAAAGVFGRYEARIVWPIVAVAIYLLFPRSSIAESASVDNDGQQPNDGPSLQGTRV